MIAGVGIDVVEVARVERMLERHGARFLARCFASGEVRRPDDPTHIAGLLAAKEAAYKALAADRGDGVGWRDMVVTADGARRVLRLDGAAADLAGRRRVSRTHLSISHDGGVAVAVVVLEATGQ